MNTKRVTGQETQRRHEAEVVGVAASLPTDLVGVANNNEAILAIRIAGICGFDLTFAQEVAHKVVSCDIEPNGDSDG